MGLENVVKAFDPRHDLDRIKLSNITFIDAITVIARGVIKHMPRGGVLGGAVGAGIGAAVSYLSGNNYVGGWAAVGAIGGVGLGGPIDMLQLAIRYHNSVLYHNKVKAHDYDFHDS